MNARNAVIKLCLEPCFYALHILFGEGLCLESLETFCNGVINIVEIDFREGLDQKTP